MGDVTYVWALHDFVPEHDDEIDFRAGDRIQIIEKDELYGDGWWQGRSPSGKVGLFPEAYTTRDPPALAHGAPLHALPEEPSDDEKERETPNPMAATLTDVQAAIEQLGVRGPAAASRSFSFASTRTGESESEPDADDEDGAWHRNARTALAAAAARNNPAPPIPLEMSDESEDDDDHHMPRGNDLVMRAQSPPGAHTPTSRAKSPSYVVPSPSDRVESPPPTATAATFRTSPLRSNTPRATSPLSIPLSPTKAHTPRPNDPRNIFESSDGSPVLPPSEHSTPPTETEPHPIPTSQSLPTFSPAQSLAAALRSASPGLRSNSPALRSAEPVVRAASPVPAPSTASLPTPVTPTLTRSPAPSVLSFSSNRYVDRRSSSPYPPPTGDLPALPTHPATTDSRSPATSVYTPSIAPKELPQAARDPTRKYTGGTMGLPSPATSASGAGPSASLSPTRFRQASSGSDAATPLPPASTPPTVSAPFSQTPSGQWTVPQVIAWLQSKGFDPDVQRAFQENDITGDVLQDLDGPTLKDEIGITAFGKRMRLLKAIGELKRETEKQRLVTKRSSTGWSSSSRPPSAMESADEDRLRVRTPANRPTSLILSPSEGALATRGLWDANRNKDDRGGESSHKTDINKAKQFFDQPQQTPTTTIKTGTDHTSKSDPSESGSTPISSFPPSPSFKRVWADKDKDKEGTPKSATSTENGSAFGHSKKRSTDATSTNGAKDRLSIFGTALGKGRKPAPRYSQSGDVAPEERSHRSLSRLYMGSGSQRKSKAGVPPSPGATSLDNEARKRTISGPVGPLRSASPAGAFNINRSPVAPTPARQLSTGPHHSAPAISPVTEVAAGARALDQIGEPDYSGWMRKKGDRYNSWKLRYFVLKGPHLYYLRSRTETKIKGYVDITGYKVIADENANPGRYGFRIVHDTLKPHFFSSEEQVVVREWMKALMKATIARNYSDPVRSSCNVPTIPLAIAQQMNPAPRPPSPSEREAAQRATRRENPNQLSSRDARILMGLPENGPMPREPSEQHRMNSFFVENGQAPVFNGYNPENNAGSGFGRASLAETSNPTSPISGAAPTRPSRELRPRVSKTVSRTSALSTGEQELVEWVNGKLPPNCPLAEDLAESMASGLILFRLAESIKETDSGVPDSAFPQGPGDDRLDGLFKLFDFLLDNDVRMGAVSINDVRSGNSEKIAQLVRALKLWEDKRRASSKQKQGVGAGPWMAYEQVRSRLKSVRARKEGLDEMKRRERTVDHKADAADKKLAKMGPEVRRQARVEPLNDLKEERRRLDIDILNEEAAIGDYKRQTTREFLALKFAAMVELAEKTTIIGDLGKLMIEGIPLHTTPPGQPRALYSGREKTSELSSEAMRCLSEIRLNLPTMPESAPATITFEPCRHTNDSSAPMSATEYGQGTYGSGAPGSQGFYNEFGESHCPAGSSGFSAGSLRIGDDGSWIGNTGGSQFHTLPASGGGFHDRLAAITLRDDGPQETFSSSVADALSRDPAFSNPPSAPTPPPHQPTAPVGTYAPPLGPPPGALQPTLSHSYFTGILPDPTQPSSPLVPPHAFSATSPWDSTLSSPNLSRPLPDRPQSQIEETRTDLAYARDPSPVPPSPQPPVSRELPPDPPQPPSHNVANHEPASPPPHQVQG